MTPADAADRAGNARLSASANSSAVSKRDAGSSASARAKTARSAARSAPGISVRLSTASRAEPADAARPQQLVRQRRQAEHVGAAIPRAARDPLRRACTDGAPAPATPTRSSACAIPRPVSRVSSDDSSTSRGCSAPCTTCDGRGEVERAGQLRGDAQRVGRRRRPVLADHEVERIGGDVLLGEIGGRRRECRRASGAASAGCVKIGGDEPIELGDQLMHALGRQIEA